VQDVGQAVHVIWWYLDDMECLTNAASVPSPLTWLLYVLSATPSDRNGAFTPRCAPDATAVVRLSAAPQRALTFEFEASVINSRSDRARLMMTRSVTAILSSIYYPRVRRADIFEEVDESHYLRDMERTTSWQDMDRVPEEDDASIGKVIR
jgi:hypothetical protein